MGKPTGPGTGLKSLRRLWGEGGRGEAKDRAGAGILTRLASSSSRFAFSILGPGGRDLGLPRARWSALTSRASCAPRSRVGIGPPFPPKERKAFQAGRVCSGDSGCEPIPVYLAVNPPSSVGLRSGGA